jgi:23S rRNA (uracil1939-C5)-methyltransferase
MQKLCPNPEVCGSCGWSHIPYQKQLQQKLSDINGSFKLKKLDLTVQEILSAPSTEHYRNRMDFVIDWQGAVGLREKGKWWRVIDDHTCFLADLRIEAVYKEARDWAKSSGFSYYDRKANIGLLRYAVIRSTSLGQSMLNVVTSAPVDEAEAEALQNSLRKLAVKAEVTTLIWSINHTITDVSFGDEMHIIHGPGQITEEIMDYKYQISPNAFFQTNPAGAELLLKTVREFAGSYEIRLYSIFTAAQASFRLPWRRMLSAPWASNFLQTRSKMPSSMPSSTKLPLSITMPKLKILIG